MAELGFEPLQPGSRVQVLFEPFCSPCTHYPEALIVPPSTSPQSHLHLPPASLSCQRPGLLLGTRLSCLCGDTGPFATRTRLWATYVRCCLCRGLWAPEALLWGTFTLGTLGPMTHIPGPSLCTDLGNKIHSSPRIFHHRFLG